MTFEDCNCIFVMKKKLHVSRVLRESFDVVKKSVQIREIRGERKNSTYHEYHTNL